MEFEILMIVLVNAEWGCGWDIFYRRFCKGDILRGGERTSEVAVVSEDLTEVEWSVEVDTGRFY